VWIVDVEEVDTFLRTLQTVSWSHNFTIDGTITGATLSVSLWDDNDSGSEFALGVAHGSGFAIGEVDTGTYSYSLNTSGLDDGILWVSVTSLFGDFGVGNSLLRVEFEPSVSSNGSITSISIPEPATLSLLGAGLILIGFASRRRSRQ
jgi:hypothetical protein